MIVRPSIFWIREIEPLRLAITPCPPSSATLADTVMAWRVAGISRVVSLLEPDEAMTLGLADEPKHCAEQEIKFVSHPIPDQSVPDSLAAAVDLVHSITHSVNDGTAVAIHCRAGIGRSGLVAGGVLVSLGIRSSEAIRMLTRARGMNVPQTRAQEEWIRRFASTVLTPGST